MTSWRSCFFFNKSGVKKVTGNPCFYDKKKGGLQIKNLEHAKKLYGYKVSKVSDTVIPTYFSEFLTRNIFKTAANFGLKFSALIQR